MFTKLLKREWKASFRLLSIMSLAALGVGVLEAAILRMLLTSGEMAFMSRASGTLVSLLLFLTLAIAAYVIGVQIFLIVRFYKNKFSNEGYLTFTLPVSCEQIFLSSMVNMAIWTVISGAVTALCVVIIIAGGTAGTVDGGILKYLWEDIVYVFEFNADLVGGAYWPLLIINAISSLFSGPVLVMTAFTLGSVVAKKRKVLVSLCMIYLISMAASVVSAVFVNMADAAMLGASGDVQTLMEQISYYIEVFLQIAMSIGGYILSVWLMKNKLNLT